MNYCYYRFGNGRAEKSHGRTKNGQTERKTNAESAASAPSAPPAPAPTELSTSADRFGAPQTFPTQPLLSRLSLNGTATATFSAINSQATPPRTSKSNDAICSLDLSPMRSTRASQHINIDELYDIVGNPSAAPIGKK